MARLFPKKDQDQINLLPEREFASSVTGRVLSWIVSTFRIIVISTEILVMIAFLSRFWLDAQNTDLTEELEEKKAVLSASSDFERQFRDTQERLRIYSELTKTSLPSFYISAIGRSLPPDVSLAEVIRLSGGVEIQGHTTNERSAQQFVVNLESTGVFSEVSLIEIKSNQINPSLLSFVVKAIPKEGESQ